MTPDALAFLGLTAIVGALVGAADVRRAAVLRRRAQPGPPRSGAPMRRCCRAALQEAVTKLKAQERATAPRADASERLSGEIITSLTAGLLVVGLDGKVQILNPAGRRMLSLGAGQHQGDDYRDMLAHAAPVAALIDECLKTGQPIVRRSIELPAAPAGTHKLGVTVSPLFDAAAELHGAICLFTDLTAVIELEEQLRLKESLATVGELTAGIAHEFRNGLATIHGYSKLFDLDALPPAFRTYVEGIRAETESLRRGRHQLPQLRAAGAADAVAGRSPRHLRARRRRAARRRARAGRRRHGARRVRRPSKATKCCCGRRSATCCATPRGLRGCRRPAARDHPLRDRSRAQA